MDMMMMMMQLPEFSSAYGNGTVDGFPPPEFFGAANSSTRTSTTMSLSDLIDNPPNPMPWSSFTHLPSSSTTTSFSNNPTPVLQQQDQTPAPALLANSGNESWRGTTVSEDANNPYGTVPSQKRNSMAAMREMIFRIAVMQPIHIDPESVKPPKRRNVKISKDPQSVAARHRRERISERIRILQRLVPGGTKMDTASMLDEAIHYVKFLKNQVQSLERAAANNNTRTVPGAGAGIGFPVAMSSRSATASASATAPPYLPLPKPNYQARNVEHYGDE